MQIRDVVIVSAVRTPVGRFLGSLKDLTAPELGALVVRAAVARAGIEPGLVDECLMGNVLQAGNGQNPARQAALNGGLDERVAALTINKVCGSGLKAVMLAAQGIAVGDIDVAVAGGMESMSNAPYLLPRVREGLRMGNGTVVDSMIADGLWCAFDNCHMGNTGEVVAEAFTVSREEQDRFAVESHRRAAHATREGWFRDEILPVTLPQKKGPPLVFDRDEGIREGTSETALAALRPAFKDGGTVTAGNAPGVNDGAAAVLVMSADTARDRGIAPMARIAAQATTGLAPRMVLMTPVEAVRTVASKAGWSLADIDLFEINEAFSVQLVAVMQQLGVDPERVNVNGGAVALGHAIGSSGARVLTTLLYEMKRRDVRRGVAALCLGGGNGVALAIERTQGALHAGSTG